MANNHKVSSQTQSRNIFRWLGNLFVKKKIDYFDIFITGVSISLDATTSLKEFLSDGGIDEMELEKIKDIKQAGTDHVHESLKIVEDAFITPIDQKDIVEILKGIEQVLHSVESVANHFYIMRVGNCDEAMCELINIEVSLCEKLYDLMVAFKRFKESRSDNINELIRAINILEEQGDRAYSKSMLQLFSTEKDVIVILKKKEMYQRLEYSIDCFKRVGDMVDDLITVTK